MVFPTFKKSCNVRDKTGSKKNTSIPITFYVTKYIINTT